MTDEDSKTEGGRTSSTAELGEAGGLGSPGSLLPPGTRVGRYVVLKHLGSGGMAVVYAAYDPELDRKVALKLIEPTLFSAKGGTTARARLIREAQAMARLSHPNVVSVYDAGTTGEDLFIAMELVEGETLKEWLARSHTPDEILEVLLRAGRGLAAAHRAGLVHRDFKPSNVLVGEEGRVQVTDFGVARPADPPTAAGGPPEAGEGFPPGSQSAEGLTRPGAAPGTPEYMAPEQKTGGIADARSDQYGFAVTLFEALVGRRPRSNSTEPDAALHELPRWQRRILERALGLEPSARYASMDELLAELSRRPTKRTWRYLAAGALLAALVAVTESYRWATDAPRRQCARAGEGLRGAWGPAAKQRAREAFQKAGKPYAETSWLEVERVLDAYAERWVALSEETCVAKYVRGEEALAGRASCLDSRREELAALVELLVQPKAETIQEAVSAAQALTPLAPCERTLGSQSVPFPLRSHEAAKLRSKVVKSKALYEAGRYAEALAVARESFERIRGSGIRMLEAEARYQLGRAEEKTGAVKAAEESFFEGALAAESAGSDELAARMWSYLVYVVGYEQARFEEGFRFERHARAAIERLGGSAELGGDLENALGAVYRAQDNFPEALRHFEASLALHEKAFGPNSPRIAGTLNNMGGQMMALGRMEEATQFFRRALSIREASLGPGHPAAAPVLANLGEAQARQGDLDEALASYRRAQETFEAAQGRDHPSVAPCLNGEGVVLARKGRFEEALALHQRALEVRQKALGPDHPWVAYDLTGIGRSLIGLGRSRLAIPPLERALKLRSGPHVDPRELAETKYNLARALANGGHAARARRLARSALEAFVSGGGRPWGSLTEVEELSLSGDEKGTSSRDR